MITLNEKTKAHNDIDKIFKNILPEYGMTERKEQIKLAHAMLDNMFDGGIALSDAGTGIGKTYAYLVAGVVFSKHRAASGEMGQPIVVSTATVALQKAVHDEYIPFLSGALLHAGYIDKPLLSVIRKGKSRYVCDKRLKKRLKSLDLKKKNRRNAEALLALKKCIDMDTQPDLSGYDRRQVAVPRSCRDCTMDCRYERFVDDCSSEKYLFQICNHNLLLADAMHTHCDRHPILPNYCALIIDEAHKLPATARQMFGRTLGYDDILSLVNGLRSEHYPLAAQNLIAAMKPIAKGMTADTDEQAETFKKEREKLLEQGLKTLNSIKRVLGNELSRQVYLELTRMIATLDLFLDDESDIIIYTDRDEHNRPLLCATAADLSFQMDRSLWSMPLPILLTSGTLAVGDDFSRFKSEACLTESNRLTESVSLSHFDYEHNCMMYVPHSTPQYKEDDLEDYFEDLTADIADLLEASSGHALVLFNSYSAMSAVRERLDDYDIPQPIFVMSRSNPYIAEEFKESGNGILLATGAAWEGMDFPGDLVSMLIIPRLPFPIPDAFSEYQKEQYDTLKDFIHAVALPDMQIKLRQGFGRAIRLETDTCIVAILDERALRARRYHDAVKTALPDMPLTGSLRSVERFLRKVKDDAYFAEV